VFLSLSFNLALAFFVPPAFTNIDWKTYMIFGTFCVVMFFHVFFTYPETYGKSLEEIDLVFEGEVPPWRSSTFGGTFQDRVEERRRQSRGQRGAAGTDDLREDRLLPPDALSAHRGNIDPEKGMAVPARESGTEKEEYSHRENV
jgi:hypothetical protein